MNILFIFSQKQALSAEKPIKNWQHVQFGLSYLSSVLRTKGHRTELFVVTRYTSEQAIDEHIRALQPKLICFTSVFTEYDLVRSTAAGIKQRFPDIYLVAGGTHITLCPEDCTADVFDALCIGEGEGALVELTEQLEKNIRPGGIPNLWFKTGNGIEKNATRPFLQDLDSLAFPDRSMWLEWVEEPPAMFSVLLGRGCPFMCTYCSNHALRRTAEGSYVRTRSAENILAELRHIRQNYPTVKEIFFEIETFGVNIPWAIALCHALSQFNKEMPFPWVFGVNLRIAPGINEDLFKAMQEAHFKYINIGLESGSPRIRRDIMNRSYTNEEVRQMVQWAHAHGVRVTLNVMMGLPTETVDDFQETIDAVRQCQPDHYALDIFFPYPGTRLHELSIQMNLLPNTPNTEMERRQPVLTLPGFSPSQIRHHYRWFEYFVYKGHKPLTGILLVVFRNTLFSSPYIRRLAWLLARLHAYSLLAAIWRKIAHPRYSE